MFDGRCADWACLACLAMSKQTCWEFWSLLHITHWHVYILFDRLTCTMTCQVKQMIGIASWAKSLDKSFKKSAVNKPLRNPGCVCISLVHAMFCWNQNETKRETKTSCCLVLFLHSKECQVECQIPSQVEGQNICQIDCQIECQNICQINVRIYSRYVQIYVLTCPDMSWWGALEEK